MKFCQTLILMLFPACLLAGTVNETSSDREQSYLELDYLFSNNLGICMDTMENLALYHEIYNWIGTPYRYSGESRKGIDCSGFVCSIFQKVFNKTLGQSSRDIYKTNITPLKSSELQEGDLVFFRIRKKSVSHVGIYLGNGKFVHASTRHGVIISSLEEPYYQRYFYKGGRLKSE